LEVKAFSAKNIIYSPWNDFKNADFKLVMLNGLNPKIP